MILPRHTETARLSTHAEARRFERYLRRERAPAPARPATATHGDALGNLVSFQVLNLIPDLSTRSVVPFENRRRLTNALSSASHVADESGRPASDLRS